MLTITICDDSTMARKQLQRSLPADWDAIIHYAEDGEQGLKRVRAGQAEVLFLDLNMPVMDGYQTLAAIQQEQLDCFVIVVSGDIQPQAQQRVQQLGAMAFIKKPMAAAELRQLLRRFGLYQAAAGQLQSATEDTALSARDTYQEVANVAMGRAGDLLARVFKRFINLPVPTVNIIAPSELHMALTAIDTRATVSAVSQGFAGSGVNGEALVIFNDTAIADLTELLGYQSTLSPAQTQLEAVMDTASIISSACLQGLSEQLHVQFSPSQPVLLARDSHISDLLSRHQERWQRVLAIEIGYSMADSQVSFDLLLLFPQVALPALDRLLTHLLESSS
ncbi:response regulator [Idiomarina xiamenensis]|uniref:Chemotaxis response regulator n=1 Tax=Idiomarina xiamenensis 10-D-4 TaxID=740709 RepID=K2KBS6_9GAMM|nr:response regulator [Idiomarina xiamenensis]EKE85258.1 chemotaxis response regulator [Idiomarina xiamenensis 10-D-4]